MILPPNILRIASTILLVLAIIVLILALHRSYKKSAVMELEVERLETEIVPLVVERDSLRGIVQLRADSLRANKQVVDSLLSANTRLRRALRRIDVDVKPDFSYAGTDSSLAAAVDSILRARGGYE